MAFKMPNLFGAKPPVAPADEFDVPTTQVKMASAGETGYDPLASVSAMDQVRAAPPSAKMPGRLPIIGSMPVVKQFQVLGSLLALFLVFAAFMVFLENRQSTQSATATSVATEMQMLSQRLATRSAWAPTRRPCSSPMMAAGVSVIMRKARPAASSSRCADRIVQRAISRRSPEPTGTNAS